jgi:hypothetical protein
VSNKAKCPACGDEEGVEAKSMNDILRIYGSASIPNWTCFECDSTSPSKDWATDASTELTRLHPDDIEAIARRVVELMKG